MKSRIVRIVAIAVMAVYSMNGKAQVTTDPILTAAVIANTTTISVEVEKTNALQAAALAQNTAMNALLQEIHNYEKKMHDYMSKAQNVISNATSIIRALKMAGEIVQDLAEISKLAVGHPMGVVVSAMVTDTYFEVGEEAVTLAGYITGIVKGGGDNNLLNSAERLRVLNNINTSLYNLSSKLWVLKCNITYMGLRDLFRELTPELYYSYHNTKYAYESTVRSINELKRELKR